MTGWDVVIIDPVKNMLDKVATFIPLVIGALAIFTAGWLIAKISSGLVQKVLDLLKFNDFSNRIGFSDVLSKGKIVQGPSALLASVVYWSVMIVVFAVTVDVIGLNVAADLLVKLVGYIPRVVSAIFVMIVGMFFANLISGLVKTAAANASLPRAEFLASISRGAFLVFTTVVVLQELHIAAFFVTMTFQIFFGAICFALALAFGLGGKDLAAKILWDFFNNQNINK